MQTGYLDERELRRMIEANTAPDLPLGLVRALMKHRSSELNGQINFEDFCKLSQEQQSLMRGWCVKYCRQIVPKRISMEEDTSRFSMETNYDDGIVA